MLAHVVSEAWSCLVQLNLGDNFLRELPSEIGELKSLKKLYLDHNELLEMCKEIGKLTALKVVEMWDAL